MLPSDSKTMLDDAGRLDALRRTRLLDSEVEVSFDNLTALAVQIIDVPVCLVSLVEPDRQFFKSQIGLGEPYASTRETPIEYSFCQHVVMSGEPLVVEEAHTHPLVCDNPAIEALDVVAYLGIPLTTQDGWHLGSLCVIDNEPREWREEDMKTLTTLAAAVTTEIELRLEAVEQEALVAQLETQNQQLEAFSHTVSHNLKNAISGIVGWADLSIQYSDRMEKDELLESMSNILEIADKTNDTIHAMLLLAGMDLADEVDIQPLNMFHILEDALTRLEQQIIQTEAVVRVPDSLPTCLGYRAWVEEIWMNYISNALKYGGTPPILEFGAEVLPGGGVKYWIKDNGAGISSEDQETLFKSFSRLAQNKSSIEGHGLGLSIVKRITEKLGGTAAVESAPGAGSMFSFTLPSVS